MNKNLTTAQKVALGRAIFQSAFEHLYEMHYLPVVTALECIESNTTYPFPKETLCAAVVNLINRSNSAYEIISSIREAGRVLTFAYNVARVENVCLIPANKEAWKRYSPAEAKAARIIEKDEYNGFVCAELYRYKCPAPYGTHIIYLLTSGEYTTKVAGESCYGTFEDCVDFLQFPSPCPH